MPSLTTVPARAIHQPYTIAVHNALKADLDYLTVAGGNLGGSASITVTNEFHVITGAGTLIDTIAHAAPIAGQRVRLLLSGGPHNLRHNVGNLILAGGIHAGFVDGEMIELVYHSGDARWHELSRSPKHLSGQSVDYSGSAAPAGYFVEDGSAISRGNYAALFAVISTTYGTGDGSTTFNLPDSRGRVAVGQGTHADVSSVGANDGLGTVAARRPKHKHTVVNPTVNGHNHGGGAHGHTVAALSSGPTSGAANAVQRVNTADGSVSVDASAAIISTEAPGTNGGTVGPQTGSEPTDSSAYLVRPKVVRV